MHLGVLKLLGGVVDDAPHAARAQPRGNRLDVRQPLARHKLPEECVACRQKCWSAEAVGSLHRGAEERAARQYDRAAGTRVQQDRRSYQLRGGQHAQATRGVEHHLRATALSDVAGWYPGEFHNRVRNLPPLMRKPLFMG